MVDAGTLYGWEHYRLGFLDEMRDGARPFLGATFHPLSFALFNPLDTTQALVEAEGPFPDAGNASQLASGDFDRDGADELAIYLTSVNSLVVLDGRTLETKATADMQDASVFALDVDGDGEDELLTITGDETNQSIHSWILREGSLVEVGSAELPFEQRAKPTRGDFDGDSQFDLALFATESDDDPAPVVLLRGGSSEGSTLALETFAGPASWNVVAADMDGDDDHELVVLHTASTMTVMDWTGDGLSESESITLEIGDATDAGHVTVQVGEDQGRPDWLIISGFRTPDPDGTSFDAAVFLGRSETHFIPLEFDPILVADYDGDGLSDFTVQDTNAIVYLSADDDAQP